MPHPIWVAASNGAAIEIVTGIALFIRDLKVGDHFTQQQQGQTLRFHVLAIEAVGRQVEILFDTDEGAQRVRYANRAVLTGASSLQTAAADLLH